MSDKRSIHTMFQPIHEETLMCSKGGCCPKIAIFEDGSAELVDDDGEMVVLNAMQAKMLRDLLTAKIPA